MSKKTQIAVAAALALAIMPAIAVSQTNAAKAPAAKSSPARASGYKAPRLSDGRPDIGGFWQNGTLTKLTRDPSLGDRKNYTEDEVRKIEGDNAARTASFNKPTDPNLGVNTPDQCQSGSRGAACGYNAGWTDPGDHIMRVNGEPRTSLITYPANGRPPAAKGGAGRGGRGPAPVIVADDGEGGEGAPPPARGGGAGRGGGRGGAAAAPQGGAAQYANPETAGLAMRCIMSFGQSTGPIMLSQLYNNNYRFVQGKDTVAIWVEMVHDVRIIRIGGKHRTDGVRPYMGDSIGHYEGDTLVVETTNFPPTTNLQGSSANLTMIEKFTRVGPNRLLYQFEARDPTVWDQPWGGEYEFVRSTGVFEYACHEGNYALEGVLAGARAEDRAAAGNRASATPAAQAR
jgi:hypothetical protein